MSEWKRVKLGEILNFISKGTTPPKGVGFVDKGINYVKSEAIGYDRKLDKTKIVQINKETHQKFKRSQLAENDILFSMAGIYLGKNAIVTKEILPANTNQALAILRLNQEEANPNYVSLYLSQQSMIDFINNMSGQSAQPNVNFEEIKSIEINLPPLPEQTAIASVLSSLDDKIDLLHRQNATLEQLAETLFRQWFVEEAKEEWEEGKIYDYAIHFKESIQPQKNQSTLYAHYSIPSFDNGKNPVQELGGEIQSNKYKIPNFCILFSKLNPHKDKRVWLLQNEVETNGICSTEFQVVFPKKRQYLYFLYGWLTLNENYNEIASGVGGTSGSHQRIDPNSIFAFKCPFITEGIIERYNFHVEPIFKKQVINQTQIRTLTAMRDTLLPKLMSGEVRVKF